MMLILAIFILGYPSLSLSVTLSPTPKKPCYYQKWYDNGQVVTIANQKCKCVDGQWIPIR